jgi:glycosyltransferase involved in cell wall biosynthesis
MLTSCYPLRREDVSCVFVHRLSKALVQEGVEVSVVAPGSPDAAGHELMDGVEIHRFTYLWPRRWQKLTYGWGIPENLRANRLLYLAIPFFLFFFLVEAIRRCRCADVIHAHWIPSGWIGLIAGRLFGRPVVLTIHGSDARLLPAAVSRWVLRNVAEVNVVSVEMQEIVRSLGRDGVLIPVLIDEELFNPEADPTPVLQAFDLDGPVVTFVARLNEFRNPLGLVRAMPFVLAESPETRFLIIGDGPQYGEVIHLAERLGVRERLTMTGAREDVYRFLGASSVFVALSPIDNVWTCAIAEAMLVGVPSILSDAGFTGSFFTHGQNCYLVPVDDDQALASAILTLLNDESLRERLIAGANDLLVEKGRRSATVLQSTMEVYRRVIEETR